MDAIPQSDLTTDEQRILKDFEQRRQATEQMTVYCMAAFVKEHWDDFACFLGDIGEHPKYFEPHITQWQETHAVYRMIHDTLGVSGTDRDQLARLKEILYRVSAEIERQSGQPAEGGVVELWKKRNRNSPEMGQLFHSGTVRKD